MNGCFVNSNGDQYLKHSNFVFCNGSSAWLSPLLRLVVIISNATINVFSTLSWCTRTLPVSVYASCNSGTIWYFWHHVALPACGHFRYHILSENVFSTLSSSRVKSVIYLLFHEFLYSSIHSLCFLIRLVFHE